MATFKELLIEAREDLMPMLVSAIETDRDLEWMGTALVSDDFEVFIRSNFVLLPAKLLAQRLAEASAMEEHKKVFQSEKAIAYIEKLSAWMDKFNKDQKADGEKEIEEGREFISMLLGAIEGDRDPEWLGGYILSADFDAAIRCGFVLLPPDVVLKRVSEIGSEDQKKALQSDKAKAYVAKLSKWLDDFNKAQKAAAAAEFAERQAASPSAADAPPPPVPEAIQAK